MERQDPSAIYTKYSEGLSEHCRPLRGQLALGPSCKEQSNRNENAYSTLRVEHCIAMFRRNTRVGGRSRHSTYANDFSTLLGLDKVPGNLYQFFGDGSLALHTYRTKTQSHEIKIRSWRKPPILSLTKWQVEEPQETTEFQNELKTGLDAPWVPNTCVVARIKSAKETLEGTVLCTHMDVVCRIL